MPLSSVQVSPLSVTVTGALTAGLATAGAASSAASADAAKVSDPTAAASRRRKTENRGKFMWFLILLRPILAGFGGFDEESRLRDA